MSEARRWDDGLDVPIMVSVTGHVDLVDEEVPGIRGKVRGFLENLRREYPSTRVIVMSALARGADILVSEEALDLGIHVAPVLPMPIEQYRGTIGDPDSLSRFDGILGNPLTYTPYLLRTESADERDSFRNLSAFLIFNSHIMLGLWDGREYDRNGGTYDTLRMAYGGVDAVIRARYLDTVVRSRRGSDRIRYLDSAEDCLIYRIEAGRTLSDDQLRARGCAEPGRTMRGEGYIVPLMVSYDTGRDSLFEAKMHAQMPASYDSAFRRIDEMNRDMGAEVRGAEVVYRPGTVAANTAGHEKRGSRFYLLDTEDVPEEVRGYVEEVKSEGVMDAAADRYHVVDQMALDYQNGSFSRIHLMIVVAVLTSLSFSVFILSGGSLAVNLVYTALLLLGILMSRVHIRRKTYSKFIEYRALAESMRVEYYRGLMGSREPVPELCYGYMKNELFWIRSVLKAWNSNFLNDYGRVTCIDGYEKKSMAIAENCWMVGQKRYHDSKRGKNERLYNRYNEVSRALVLATTLISAVLIIALALFPDVLSTTLVAIEPVYAWGMCLVQGLDVTVSVVIRVVMIVLVAMTSYESMGSELIHGGTPEQIDAKRQMFAIAEIRMRETDDPKVRREILWELGDQCIDEMNDWVFEHKGKDFKRGSMSANAMEIDS